MAQTLKQLIEVGGIKGKFFHDFLDELNYRVIGLTPSIVPGDLRLTMRVDYYKRGSSKFSRSKKVDVQDHLYDKRVTDVRKIPQHPPRSYRSLTNLRTGTGQAPL